MPVTLCRIFSVMLLGVHAQNKPTLYDKTVFFFFFGSLEDWLWNYYRIKNGNPKLFLTTASLLTSVMLQLPDMTCNKREAGCSVCRSHWVTCIQILLFCMLVHIEFIFGYGTAPQIHHSGYLCRSAIRWIPANARFPFVVTTRRQAPGPDNLLSSANRQ